MATTTTTPYLDLFRAQFGLRRKIERSELQQFLSQASEQVELPLREYSNWYGVSPEADIGTIARAMANAPSGITVLSLGGQVRDIQYDQPGSMNPMQYAQISFVGVELGQSDNSMHYLRRHAARVIVVAGEPLKAPPPPPEQPRKAPYWCPDCDTEVMAEDHDERTTCPRCGANIGQWFL